MPTVDQASRHRVGGSGLERSGRADRRSGVAASSGRLGARAFGSCRPSIRCRGIEWAARGSSVRVVPTVDRMSRHRVGGSGLKRSGRADRRSDVAALAGPTDSCPRTERIRSVANRRHPVCRCRNALRTFRRSRFRRVSPTRNRVDRGARNTGSDRAAGVRTESPPRRRQVAGPAASTVRTRRTS